MILISHIRQFMFCPRIFYFYNLCNIKLHYPEYVKAGVEFHAKQDELFKSRKFSKFQIPYIKIYNNFYLENNELCGVADLILECDDEIIVAEFKNQGTLRPSAGSKMQLIAYSKLASEFFNKPFNKIILCHGKNLKFKIFQINQADIANFNKILEQMKGILENENFPNSSASLAACAQCEFRNYCDDRE